jgi:hypothetical protein
MFDNFSDRIAGTLLMGLDVAVEFATLGEFRLVDPAVATAGPAPPASLPMSLDVRRPHRRRLLELEDVDRALLPRPSTALARATAPAGIAVAASSAQPRPATPTTCERRRRRDTPGPGARRTPSRARAGAIQAPVQLCLLLD